MFVLCGIASKILSGSRCIRLMALCVGLCLSTILPALAGPTDVGAPVALETFPDGCGNPFLDYPLFLSFYDNAISMLVAKRGVSTKGAGDLFAVSELRVELNTLIPNPTGETALDRLIVSQLCQFADVERQSRGARGMTQSAKIDTSSDVLLDHLSNVGTRLYVDARKIVVAALADRARQRQKDNLLATKWSEIRRAREMGRQKIDDLFTP